MINFYAVVIDTRASKCIDAHLQLSEKESKSFPNIKMKTWKEV